MRTSTKKPNTVHHSSTIAHTEFTTGLKTKEPGTKAGPHSTLKAMLTSIALPRTQITTTHPPKTKEPSTKARLKSTQITNTTTHPPKTKEPSTKARLQTQEHTNNAGSIPRVVKHTQITTTNTPKTKEPGTKAGLKSTQSYAN